MCLLCYDTGLVMPHDMWLSQMFILLMRMRALMSYTLVRHAQTQALSAAMQATAGLLCPRGAVRPADASVRIMAPGRCGLQFRCRPPRCAPERGAHLHRVGDGPGAGAAREAHAARLPARHGALVAVGGRAPACIVSGGPCLRLERPGFAPRRDGGSGQLHVSKEQSAHG
jgi:hypothetical protein